MDETFTRACRRKPERVPLATYRLQFSQQFTFSQATAMVDYLAELGISDLYASPLLQATPESTHGYDVCSFRALNPNLGTGADFDTLVSNLQAHQMGLLLDIVPNHMAASLSNAWWVDVLENGPASPYASWFDIDWQPPEPALQNKVLVPVLEDDYRKVLEAGKLKLVFDHGRFGLAYYHRIFPLAPDCYRVVLQRLLENEQDSDLGKNVAALIHTLGARAESSTITQPEFEKLKERLRIWSESSPQLQESLAQTLAEINGNPGQPPSFEFLDALLRKQHYQLAYWRNAPEQINYRRFFDVTELVSLRMELPDVFQQTHDLVCSRIRDGKVTGLRIDHPDGLWDPKEYFERLQTACDFPCYIVVEKILTAHEPLPEDWPVAGTTGYDFLNRLNAIFVQPANASAFDSLYSCFCSDGEAKDHDRIKSPPTAATFESVACAGKQQVLRASFPGDLRRLALSLKQIADRTRAGADLPFNQLHQALFEVVAAFPVYRTYVTNQSKALPDYQKQYVIEAVANAKKGNPNPNLSPLALQFIQNLLELNFPHDLDEEAHAQCRRWVMKFQQLTAPVMAKGVEDTAFYNFNRLLSLNEVGGDPAIFGTGVSAFHDYNARKLEHWPHSLLATATHDTKRGEDLRARLNVLSEMPDEWEQAIFRWSKLNAPLKSKVDGQPAPHPNDEYLLYQTLVGAWTRDADHGTGRTALSERVCSYMLKALKEAKARTSWTSPRAEYERAMTDFVQNLLADSPNNRFIEDFKRFQKKVAFFGIFNSLSQLLLKLTCPGVPDIYQGTELWDFNLVDPDNRRPVDFETRRLLLTELKRQSAPGQLLANWLTHLVANAETGDLKFYLLWRVLQFRASQRELFQDGAYIPLQATGSKAEHLCAFARELHGRQVIVAAPRLVLALMHGTEQPPAGADVWSDTSLSLDFAPAQRPYINLFTGENVTHHDNRLEIASVLKTFPVALLVAEGW